MLFAVVARSGIHGPDAEGLPTEFPVGVVVRTAVLGVVVYTLLFGAISAATRRPIFVGVAYAMTIEGIFANFPGKTANLSVQHHLRGWLVANGGSTWNARVAEIGADLPSGQEALQGLLVIAALFLVAGMAAVRRREFLA
jgi:hypothetical protein